MTLLIYKILRRHEWEEAQKAGLFTGSADDLRDGYLHFSAASQVPATFRKYFKDVDRAILLAVVPSRLGLALKWETSRGGQRFPHLYGALPLELVHEVHEIAREADGRPIFPADIPADGEGEP